MKRIRPFFRLRADADRLPRRSRRRDARGRRAVALAGVCALWAVVSLVPADGSAAEPSLGIAPFVGDAVGDAATGGGSVASGFYEAVAARGLARVLAPGQFVAEAGLDPAAGQVRAWAYAAAIEAIVFGSVQPAVEGAPAQLELVVRSGHSGVERKRYRADWPGQAAAAPVLSRLADGILDDLGFVPPPPAAPVAGSGDAGAPSTGRSGGGGLESALDLEGFDGDAPIEIRADEAEIVNRGRGRELVFQRNVRVKQANVTLKSQRLEATYRKGESEPEKLIAQGSVEVDQAGRVARCDRAVYLRAEQQLTCSGRAELIQGCDVVRGDSIEFWLADDRARVEGAASIVIRSQGEGEAECGDAEGLL